MKKQLTCKEGVQEAMYSRLKDIETLYTAEEQYTEELGSLYEYGLCIDYVEPGTWKNQVKGFTRYQLSFGGPQEEFRIYDNSERAEFWFLDWFDGAMSVVPNRYVPMIREIMGKDL